MRNVELINHVERYALDFLAHSLATRGAPTGKVRAGSIGPSMIEINPATFKTSTARPTYGDRSRFGKRAKLEHPLLVGRRDPTCRSGSYCGCVCSRANRGLVIWGNYDAIYLGR